MNHNMPNTQSPLDHWGGQEHFTVPGGDSPYSTHDKQEPDFGKVTPGGDSPYSTHEDKKHD